MIILQEKFTPVDPDDYNLWDEVEMCVGAWVNPSTRTYSYKMVTVQLRYASNDSEITLLNQLEKILEES